MKKAAILTLNGNNNFGNKLQNYALQQYLKSNNLDAETIWIKTLKNENFMLTILRNLKKNIRYLFKENKKRIRKFKKFDKKYIKYSSKKINFFDDLSKINNKYDFFIVGSDQVWNHKMTHNFNIYFLDGVDDYKKISYAASFGTESIDNNYKDEYVKYLNKFRLISVREQKGKELIEKITDRKDTEVLIDPTMLLNVDEWDRIIKKPNGFGKKKYILNYFLGELSNQRKEAIEKVAKDNDCEIINILDKDDPYYISDPSEFLYLEKNAFFVCTDSFHSCVFAFMFDVSFVVFDREQKGIENMNSRIDTLINKFKLKNRKYNGNNITKENLDHDYSEAYKILEKEREKSKDFLEKALDIK